MIDVNEQINAVRRQVGARVLEAGEARTVTISQTYDATVDEVWDACTNPARIPRWFLPVSGDLRLHGQYQLTGNASGTIERCDPPKSFAATWEFGGSVSWIEVRVSGDPAGGTRFELEHIIPADDKWTEFGPGAVGVGWDMGLVGLAIHLSAGVSSAASPASASASASAPDSASDSDSDSDSDSAPEGVAVDPGEAAAWMASDEGKRFITLSSEHWCAANIAAGTDEPDARAAADRTTAAYTA